MDKAIERVREYRSVDIRGWVAKHRYCYALGYLLLFLPAFFITERAVTPRYIISCSWDDKIPFCETFVIWYLLWFLLLPASWLYTMVRSKEDFQNLCMIMFGGMTASIVIYWIFPNGLALRPQEMGEGVCADLVRMIHAVDTPGNVCPSIHVSSSTSVAMVAWRSGYLKSRQTMRWGVILAAAGICLSTMFLKQHSVVDVVCGAMLTVILAVPVYCMPWRGWMEGKPMGFFL